jgi:hypothetical protein
VPGVAPILTNVGKLFTVTFAELTTGLVQPVPGYVTVSEYTPLAPVTNGVSVVEFEGVATLKLFGPDQLYEESVPAPVGAPAVNVTAVPTQTFVVDGVMLATDGTRFTVADVV